MRNKTDFEPGDVMPPIPTEITNLKLGLRDLDIKLDEKVHRISEKLDALFDFLELEYKHIPRHTKIVKKEKE